MPRKTSTPKNTTNSCLSCRSRKRKCDGKSPCATCTNKNLECIYVDNDKRRKRPQTSFVVALQKAHLNNQELLEKLRENIGDYDKLKQLLNNDKNDQKNEETPHKDFNHLVVTGKNGTTSMVLGPTSVYNDIIEEVDVKTSPKSENIQQYLTPDQIKELNDYRHKYGYQSYRLFYFNETPQTLPPIFRECVSLFFKWMYSSSFLFIHRESFLYFFLSNEINCELVTMELIYAISCLGARISPDPSIRAQADKLYDQAKSTVLGPGNVIKESSISKLQSLLCLALYDLGRGELTSCWLLSGMAFRVGFDFGFELDPNEWNVSGPLPISSSVSQTVSLSASSTTLNHLAQTQAQAHPSQGIPGQGVPGQGTPGQGTPGQPNKYKLYQEYPFDVKQLRSRIYWGSYIVDRLICLVMGRPTTLQLTDVTVPDSQDIGDLTGIEDFIFYDNSSDRQYACRAFDCLKAVIELITLSDDIIKKVFASPVEGVTRLEILSKYNFKLLHWKDSLKSDLYWNKTILKKTAHNELYMGPRYTFFIIMLSINRPFVSMTALGSSKSIDIDVAKRPIEICDDVIDDLEIVIKALNNQENKYQIFCPHLLSVYAVILSISVLLWRFKICKTLEEKRGFSQKLNFFCEFLENCSSIWPLATKPANIYRKRIQNLWGEVKEYEANEYESTLGQFEYQNDFIFDKKYDWLNGFDNMNYTNIDEMFQTVFEEPTSQQFFSRLDLADALWDEVLYKR